MVSIQNLLVATGFLPSLLGSAAHARVIGRDVRRTTVVVYSTTTTDVALPTLQPSTSDSAFSGLTHLFPVSITTTISASTAEFTRVSLPQTVSSSSASTGPSTTAFPVSLGSSSQGVGITGTIGPTSTDLFTPTSFATVVVAKWPTSIVTAMTAEPSSTPRAANRDTCDSGGLVHECNSEPPPAVPTFDQSSIFCGVTGWHYGSTNETVEALVDQTCNSATGMSIQRFDANQVSWQENWNLPDGNSINMRLQWDSLAAEPGWWVLFNSVACKQGFDLPYLICNQNTGKPMFSGGHVTGNFGGVNVTWTSVVYPAPLSARGLGEGQVS